MTCTWPSVENVLGPRMNASVVPSADNAGSTTESEKLVIWTQSLPVDTDGCPGTKHEHHKQTGGRQRQNTDRRVGRASRACASNPAEIGDEIGSRLITMIAVLRQRLSNRAGEPCGRPSRRACLSALAISDRTRPSEKCRSVRPVPPRAPARATCSPEIRASCLAWSIDW